MLLTGGEPMLQRDIGVLAERLLGAGRRVMIETSGAHQLDRLPQAVIRIVDVKTPASGESHRMRWELLPELRPIDAAKFVVADEADYRWAAEVVAKYELGDANGSAVLAGPRPSKPPGSRSLDAA